MYRWRIGCLVEATRRILMFVFPSPSSLFFFLWCNKLVTCNPPCCKLNTNEPNVDNAASKAAATAAALVTSSSTGATTNGGPSFVLIVVGLLGAAMMAMQVALQQRRHRGLLRRHHYNEVENTATRIGA